MKKQLLITNILASGLLLASTISYAQNSDTDLVYGSGKVVASVSEPYLYEAAKQNNNNTDYIYGEQRPAGSPGESHDRLTDNRNNSTDLIYGS